MADADIQNLETWIILAGQATYSATLLAALLKVSRRQLQRHTQRLFRRSPQDWLNDQRLLTAARLLNGRHSVKEVAFQLGFKQVSHFSREFKRRHGVCPKIFVQQRNSHQLFLRGESPIKSSSASEVVPHEIG